MREGNPWGSQAVGAVKASIGWDVRNEELLGRRGWARVAASRAPGLGLQGKEAILGGGGVCELGKCPRKLRTGGKR